MTDQRRLYGKYRGTVCDINDPLQQGRLRAIVPAVGGVVPLTWALPCVPFAGTQLGFVALPALGANVWIEFEAGDIDFPVWTGCFWLGPGDLPSQAPPPGVHASATLQTPGLTALILSDDPAQGITLRTASGASLQLNSQGVTITTGAATITLSGNSVDINQGALKVI
jgi:uncharacterized protein involved in type VI secretion and phage assembly